MADNEDDDPFLDDDFPDIPDDELRQLEENAITFTQQEKTVLRPQGHGLPGANASSAYPQRTKIQTQNASVPQGCTSVVQNGPSTFAQQESFDSMMLDEDGLPLIVEEQQEIVPRRALDETAQREQWRVNRFAQPQTKASPRPQAFAPQDPRPSHERPVQLRPNQNQYLHTSTLHTNFPNDNSAQRSGDGQALRDQLAELERVKVELVKSLTEAREEISVRRGEIANIRARQSNEEKSYQRQLVALQKLKQEESEKHATSIQLMSTENAKIASEIQFLKQEVKEEARKAQGFQRQLKERSLAEKSHNVNTTPKRNQNFRDGFDDVEMMPVSPAKSGRRSKQGTPTANRKRKQPTGTDPSVPPLALRLSETATEDRARSAAASTKVDQVLSLVRKDRTTEQHLRLVQKVFSFRPSGGSEVLVDRLVKLSFPSEKSRTFSTVVIEASAKLQGQRLPGDLLQVFLDLWSRALKEKYHACLQIIAEVVSYILDLDPFIIDTAILGGSLSLLQSTTSINARARFNLMKKEYLNDPAKPKPMIDNDINTTACLNILHTIACLCVDDTDLISLFWRIMDTDFVLMMLNPCQPIPDMTLMLQLLATSILPNTFGNICEVTQQGRMETYICDRICYSLWELPKPDPDRPPYTEKQVCLLRLEFLNLLAQLTLGSSGNPFNPTAAENHGTVFLANHPTAIARIVRSVYDEVAAAYRMSSTQSFHIQLVNTAIRILHFVIFSPAGREIDLQRKLTGINGGVQKYRVVMTRLAFAEGTKPGIDAGITEETVRMATEMLEESITPDEVEDLVRVFEGSGGGGSGGKRASAISSTQS